MMPSRKVEPQHTLHPLERGIARALHESARWVLWLTALFTLVSLTGCTRTAVPMDVPGYSGTSVAATELANMATAAAMQAGEYAVVLVPEGEELQIHQPAGISGEVVARVSHDARDLRLTSNQTTLGSSRWVEVETPEGVSGWVNFLNLTEYVPPDLFCADSRIPGLLNAFMEAVQVSDGMALQQLVHPKRGLVIRIDAWNPEVRFSREEVAGLFGSRDVRNWGGTPVTAFPIEGTFTESVAPLLQDVFGADVALTCNAILLGDGGVEVWPGEYDNINVYSILRAAREGDNPFNWRTWVVGVEYDGGVPYVSFIVQYRAE